MQQKFTKIIIKTEGQKLTEITSQISQVLITQVIENGLVTIYIKHTSASLIIQENADSDVLRDIENFFDKLVPMDESKYIHNSEGADDMPAHIKSLLTNTQLSVPMKNKKLVLGTWQGIFLFEHRLEPHDRSIEIHIIGE
tara:strand:+ start:818 stop:1237 length:420 start_codon:yes stop_codon:yes gene_type:complete